MRNIPNPPVITIGIICALGIIGGTVLAGCSKKEDISPPEMTTEPSAAHKIWTSGTAPDLYVHCWRGLTFITTGGGHAMAQVMDTTGKPMECK
jgi:hypothetical protein